MSSADSGVAVIDGPIVVAVGVVSLAAAGISALAEKYKSYRLEKAEEAEAQKKSELEQIIALAEQNRAEYESIIEERIREEESRRSSEETLRNAAKTQIEEEARARENLEKEVHTQMENMERALKAFEGEFGKDQRILEMAETIRRSEKMFGCSTQLLQELNDFVLAVLPGVAGDKRKEKHIAQIDRRLGRIEVESFRTVDTSETFVSLYTGEETGAKDEVKTPWEKFMQRVRFVADVEAAYYESEASQMLEEAEKITPARQNYYIQKNQHRLSELEDRAAEFMAQRRKISGKALDDLYLYISIAKKLGIEPVYSEEDLSDPYLVEDMRAETEELIEEYKARRERQYVTNAITVVMKRHNLEFVNMDVREDGSTQIEYSMDQQTGVRFTRAQSGAFEMQFQGKSKGDSASLDEKRSITEKARHFCSILPSITKELEEEFGITFEQTSLQPPNAENIEIRKDTSLTRVQGARALKKMEMKDG